MNIVICFNAIRTVVLLQVLSLGLSSSAFSQVIDIISPLETNYYIGDKMAMHAYGNDNIIENFRIALYRNNWEFRVLSESHPTSQTFSWTIPNDIPASDQAIYRLRVSAVETEDYTFSEYFTIEKATSNPDPPPPSYIEFDADHKGAQLTPGQNFSIKWSDNIAGGSFTLEYWYNGNWHSIEDLATGSSHNWYVPHWLIGTIKLRIRHSSGYTDQAEGIQVGDFTIIAPTGGEAFRETDKVGIQWNPDNSINYVNISLYKDNSFYKTLAPKTLNDGFYRWTVTNAEASSGGGSYAVRIVDLRDPNYQLSGYVSDKSDPFTLQKNQLSFTSDYSNKSRRAGKPITINWSSNLKKGDIKLDYNSGSGWNNFKTLSHSETSYRWTPPNSLDGTIDIRIRSTAYSHVKDQINNLTLNRFVTVTSPKSNADLRDGQQLQVRWEDNLDAQHVKITLHSKNGSLRETLTGQTANDGAYNWRIPSSITAGTYYVQVTEAGGNTSDKSATFTITKNALTVTSPKSNEEYRDGENIKVRWDDNLDATDVTISLFSAGGRLQRTVAGQTANDGTHDWTVPSGLDGRYYVKIKDAGGRTFDNSGTFTIKQRSLTVTSPKSNADLRDGEQLQVRWEDNLDTQHVTITLHSAGGSLQQTLTSQTANDGAFDWAIPSGIAGGTYYVRVQADAGPTSGTSARFDLTKHVLGFTTAAGQSIGAGQPFTIGWDDNIGAGQFALHYRTGGGSWQPLATKNSGAGSHSWRPPAALEGQTVALRIRSTAYPHRQDVIGGLQIIPAIYAGPGRAVKVAGYEAYDERGNLLEATDARGQKITYFYGTNSQPLTQSASGIGGAVGVHLTGIRRAGTPHLDQTATYDSRGRLATTTGPAGSIRRFRYDGLGRLAAIRNDADQPVISYRYTYGAPNWIRTHQHVAGGDRVSTQYLDGLGRPVQSHQRVGAADIITARTYDGAGRPARAYKPYRRDTGHAYDPSYGSHARGWYNGSSGSRPDDKGRPFTETRYQPAPGARTRAVLPAGESAEGRSVRTGYAVRSWKGHPYQVTITTDESGNVTETWTDGWGRTVRTVADPGGIGAETIFAYDALDNLTTVTAPNGAVTTYQYDVRGRLTGKTSPDGGTTRYTYDAAGNLRFAQDAARAAAGEITYTGYDALGRPVREGVAARDVGGTDPDTDHAFEQQQANLQGVRAYDGHPDTEAYPWNRFGSLIDGVALANTRGQLTATAWRFGGAETTRDTTVQGLGLSEGSQRVAAADSISAYNTEVGSGASLRLIAGRIIRLGPGFRAKAGSEVRATIDPDQAATSGAGASRVAGANPWQVTLRSYDAEGRVADKWIWTGDKREWDTHLSYGYNRQGEITKRKISVGGQTLYQFYEYNQRGLLNKVFINTTDSKPAAPEVTYSYTATGAVETIDYRGNKDVAYGYTIRDWVKSINDVNNPGNNFAASYNYTDNGNVKIAQFHNPKIQLSGSHRRYHWRYGYDGLDRLTSADYGSGSGTASDFFDVSGITYDGAGNIETLQRRDETGSLIDDLAYDYGAGTNRLEEMKDPQGNRHGWDAAPATFGYDENGNLTSQTGTFSDIAYDHRNLPVQFSLESGQEMIANYDAGGQRILKESGGGAWQFYVRDGDQTLAVMDEEGLSHFNLVGNSTFGRYEPSGARRYYLSDHLGSTRAVVNDQGNVLETFDYYPFGLLMPKRSSTTGNTQEKFTGKERDEAIGLDYFGARYLDPALGRWASVDPAADLQESISPYAYSLNSPINFTDPDGSLPIYINGRVMSPGERGDKSYWDSNLLATIKSSGIPNPGGTREFIDGDRYARVHMGGHLHTYNGAWLSGSSPSARSLAGKLAARGRFNNILSQLERDPESGLITEKIQIYTHSRGAAFGAGFTDELMSLIKQNADQFADPGNVIDFVLNLAPHQSGAIDAPSGANGFSVNHRKDFLSGNSMGGLLGAFTSDEGKTVLGAHSTSSFIKEVSAFTKAFLSGGTSQGTIDSFIQRAKDEYGIEVTVRQ